MVKTIVFAWEVGDSPSFVESEVRAALEMLRDSGVPVWPPHSRVAIGTKGETIPAGGPLFPICSSNEPPPSGLTGRHVFYLYQEYEESMERQVFAGIFPDLAAKLERLEKEQGKRDNLLEEVEQLNEKLLDAAKEYADLERELDWALGGGE